MVGAPPTGCRKRQASHRERGECDPQTVFLAAQAILNRDIHVGERRYAIVNPSHALESKTSDRAARPLCLNNESPIPFLCLGITELFRAIHDPRNDDEHGRQELAIPLGRIRNKEFFSCDPVTGGPSVLYYPNSVRLYFGDIASHIPFSQCKP